jgi:hypothetical protein
MRSLRSLPCLSNDGRPRISSVRDSWAGRLPGGHPRRPARSPGKARMHCAECKYYLFPAHIQAARAPMGRAAIARKQETENDSSEGTLPDRPEGRDRRDLAGGRHSRSSTGAKPRKIRGHQDGRDARAGTARRRALLACRDLRVARGRKGGRGRILAGDRVRRQSLALHARRPQGRGLGGHARPH